MRAGYREKKKSKAPASQLSHMDSVVNVVISPDELATQLAQATADCLIEQKLLENRVVMQPESIQRATDAIFSTTAPELMRVFAAKRGPLPKVVANAGEAVRAEISELSTDFREWLKVSFGKAKDKLRTLAVKLLDTAKKYSISVGHLLARLYRRTIAFITESSIIPPFTVGAGTNAITMKPSELTISYTVKSQPSLASLDIAGVVNLLSGMLSVSLQVSIKYSST
jgi:hypothetical protein